MKKLTLSIVIPFYNEQSRIAGCLDALKKWQVPSGVKLEQIIFVNDGSTDSTEAKIRKHRKNAVIASYGDNRGKGYAIKHGMSLSTSDYTVFMDADMATPMSEVKKFLSHMKGGVDLIVGTRKNGVSTVIVHQPQYRELMGHAFTKLTNTILGTNFTDFTCGFKAISRKAKDVIFPKTVSERWSIDPEIMLSAKQNGFTIAEVPVVWSDKKGTKVNLFVDVPRTLQELMIIKAVY